MDRYDCRISSVAVLGRPGGPSESGVARPLKWILLLLDMRCLRPLRLSPKDLEPLSLLRFPCGDFGVGGGTSGEDGGRFISELVSARLELDRSGNATLSSGCSCLASMLGKASLEGWRVSLPANACSELAGVLSMYGAGCTGLGLKPRNR